MKKPLILLLFTCMVGISFAQETKEESKQPVSKEIAAIRIANNLAKYGYENYSALALIEAAQIFATTPTQPLKTESIEKGEPVGKEEKKTEKAEFTPTNLLADARKFADGDATLLALAEQVEKTGKEATTRGRVGGPGIMTAKVSAGGTDTYAIKFWANELAEIALSGDGDTDLDLYVYDENGNLITSDADYSDDCYVSWVPKWTGSFIVKVVNRGRVYNNYVIGTN
ncbi:hypothetical protein LJC68_03995 [Bacteroidales bacterium OttesenSCG-928-B11]|nr:hypothetical protein [Bacteroidales bacterium OttesenSCG-928-C03]MDL2312021.1 hypothetical protein [Bacteroidales bacterium OttesenSCG-928-B11]